jgi:hypothetical protein
MKKAKEYTKHVRDRSFNLQGGGYGLLFRSEFFFFPPPKSEYFFQQHWESEYLQVKWSVPNY